METLNASISADFLNIPTTPLTSPFHYEALTNDTNVKRLIVDLKVDCLSYFEVKNHVRRIYGINISRNYIADVIIEAGQRARHLNGIYDSKVRGNFKVIEIDETFQGRDACFLAVVDKESRYLLLLVQLHDRNAETIAFVLESIAETLERLELVITDGYPGYKNMIPTIFNGVAHLFCHVHAYRVFLREIEPIKVSARKAWKKWHDANQSLVELKHDLKLKKRCSRRDEQRLTRLIVSRDAFYKQQRIKKHSKKMAWTEDRIRFKTQLNNERIKARSRKKTIMNKEDKIVKRTPEVEALKAIFWKKKQVSLQSARLVAAFKRLLEISWDRFETERERFTNTLARSSLDIASKIARFMQLNPHVHATSNKDFETTCPSWRANTNTIESIFGSCRPVLDKAKRFSGSRQSMAILEILRLKSNLSPPNTGPHQHESPLQRAGINPRYENYLDALYPVKYHTRLMMDDTSELTMLEPLSKKHEA